MGPWVNRMIWTVFHLSAVSSLTAGVSGCVRFNVHLGRPTLLHVAQIQLCGLIWKYLVSLVEVAVKTMSQREREGGEGASLLNSSRFAGN